VPESTESQSPSRRASPSNRVIFPLAVLLILIFISILFPWNSVGRRMAWEISRVSGARVEVPNLSPAWTARGPVLRARNVTIEHPAVDPVRLTELEIAPRFSTSWFGGNPTLRLWATSGLGNIDGVLRLGGSPAYVGLVSQADLSRLPLRLEATGVRFRGLLRADANVALDPDGTLQGRVDFECSSLEIDSDRLPIAIPFAHASGTIEVLESGATRITEVDLKGDLVNARLNGEIGLVHRSQSPPIALSAHLRILDPTLRQLAPSAGLRLSLEGEADVELGGTLDAPVIKSLRAQDPRYKKSQ
jgi:type II secretion system protein N